MFLMISLFGKIGEIDRESHIHSQEHQAPVLACEMRSLPIMHHSNLTGERVGTYLLAKKTHSGVMIARRGLSVLVGIWRRLGYSVGPKSVHQGMCSDLVEQERM